MPLSWAQMNMILIWGMGMTGQARLLLWRILKNNSQWSDSLTPIVYSFIKHLDHPKGSPQDTPSPAES